ncbi:MAG: hypothetical protein JXK94_01710 [Deltaproteobacteria bacterium]|nr:hypothetical protein [Deltaproteobacteria bacterium]
MTNLTYHGVFFCLLLAAIEWPAISHHKIPAVFCLLAIIFYLFFLSAIFHNSSLLPTRANRVTRWIKKRQAKRAGMAMLVCSLLFVVGYMPHSKSIQIIFVCCAFFFFIFHLGNLSIGHLQQRTKKELHFKK